MCPNGTDANLNLSANSRRGATDCIGSNFKIKFKNENVRNLPFNSEICLLLKFSGATSRLRLEMCLQNFAQKRERVVSPNC